MAKAYSMDLRERVVKFIGSGHSKAEAARVYGLSWRSVLRWEQREADNNLAPLGNQKPRNRKLDAVAVKEFIHKHPDKTLKEIGEYFGVSAVAVFKRVRALGLTYKKKSFCTKSVMKKNVRSS
jgi:transposase